jgi:hypothetical protein
MMTNQSARSRGPSPRRLGHGNPRPSEEIHDPYRTPRKAKGPARCAECGATYRKGHWTWERLLPPPPASLTCPACRRAHDHYPAGQIDVGGTFYVQHADEVLHAVRNVEKAENAQHPLHRIMTIRRGAGTLTIETTDIHLPRRIAHALESAWGGELATHYDEAGYFVRITWERND